MRWFIKTELFTKKAMRFTPEERQRYISQHITWVKNLNASGVKVSSGYLIDKHKVPGGGGLLILQAASFNEAESLIINDPIIIAGLVNWKLQEWIPVFGELIN